VLYPGQLPPAVA